MTDQPRAGESLAVASKSPQAPQEPGADESGSVAAVRPRRRRREPAVWLVAPGTFFFAAIVGIPLAIVVWTSFLRIGPGNIASWATAPFAGLSNFAKEAVAGVGQVHVPYHRAALRRIRIETNVISETAA